MEYPLAGTDTVAHSIKSLGAIFQPRAFDGPNFCAGPYAYECQPTWADVQAY